jgi:hypothetical protein
VSIPRKGTAPKASTTSPSVFRLSLNLGGKPVKTVDVKPGCCLDKKTPPPKK